MAFSKKSRAMRSKSGGSYKKQYRKKQKQQKQKRSLRRNNKRLSKKQKGGADAAAKAAEKEKEKEKSLGVIKELMVEAKDSTIQYIRKLIKDIKRKIESIKTLSTPSTTSSNQLITLIFDLFDAFKVDRTNFKDLRNLININCFDGVLDKLEIPYKEGIDAALANLEIEYNGVNEAGKFSLLFNEIVVNLKTILTEGSCFDVSASNQSNNNQMINYMDRTVPYIKKLIEAIKMKIESTKGNTTASTYEKNSILTLIFELFDAFNVDRTNFDRQKNLININCFDGVLDKLEIPYKEGIDAVLNKLEIEYTGVNEAGKFSLLFNYIVEELKTILTEGSCFDSTENISSSSMSASERSNELATGFHREGTTVVMGREYSSNHTVTPGNANTPQQHPATTRVVSKYNVGIVNDAKQKNKKIRTFGKLLILIGNALTDNSKYKTEELLYTLYTHLYTNGSQPHAFITGLDALMVLLDNGSIFNIGVYTKTKINNLYKTVIDNDPNLKYRYGLGS